VHTPFTDLLQIQAVPNDENSVKKTMSSKIHHYVIHYIKS